ncbi:GNAT family N-acetyltransferase [Candidatus Methanocrinis natronophilus]|uniref:GNAT family N-acetyltransferase n=1 Tax=Candidatus Methanocrinis natronophilus TaxID=3033396 RepID=A0ABT5XAU7_9EURY|nr:GNAT family N-acetyltransferase [Candidatus Methanocrinis natronophilus]MDF0591817.1 GNAT family N-acetyltransferase [Candidatus Methanocrinis natronophilus]
MISIRPFEEGDVEDLQKIEALSPQGDERCAMGVRKEDVIARYRMYDRWKMVVAEVDGRVAGWAGWTVKERAGGSERSVYLAEVIVSPEFRRIGVARRLEEKAEEDARKSGADHLYLYVYGPNGAARVLFEGLGYSKMAEVRSIAIPTYKRAKTSERSTGLSVERMKRDEIGPVVELINGYYRGWRPFEPFSPESFESHLSRIPGYGLENFWVAKEGVVGEERKRDEGDIVACAGLWDCSTVADFCYAREPLSWKAMGLVLRSLSRFTKVPKKIVREGEYFRFHYLTDYAFDRRNTAGMENLLSHLNNVLLEEGWEYFVACLEERDPVFPLLKRRQPQIETWHLFAKSLDRPMPDFSPFYVDIRDMIL